MKLLGKQPKDITGEERFGLTISVATHMVLLVLFWLWYSTPSEPERVAFIEVTLGEFQDGSSAQQADEQNPDLATRPKPQPKPVPNTEPKPEPETQPEVKPEETAKPVEAPEQNEDIQTEDVIETPETETVKPDVTESEPQPEESSEPDPVQTEDPVERRGSLLSGDPKGLTGDPNNQQGTSRDADKSAPYVLEWEGDINRQSVSNPMPNYTSEVEAIITVRFTVKPDGSVGRIQPLRRTDPALENEVINTLRTWRFNRLPSNVPQEEQNGVITFRFVLS